MGAFRENVFHNLTRNEAGDEVTASNNKTYHCVYLYTFSDIQLKYIMTTAVSKNYIIPKIQWKGCDFPKGDNVTF